MTSKIFLPWAMTDADCLSLHSWALGLKKSRRVKQPVKYVNWTN